MVVVYGICSLTTVTGSTKPGMLLSELPGMFLTPPTGILLRSLHPKVMLASRFSGFVKSMLASPKYAVRVMTSLCSEDHRTVMGRTMAEISKECGMCDPSRLIPTLIKKNMLYREVPAEEKWRLGLLNELLEKKLEIPGFTNDELKEIISFACTE